MFNTRFQPISINFAPSKERISHPKGIFRADTSAHISLPEGAYFIIQSMYISRAEGEYISPEGHISSRRNVGAYFTNGVSKFQYGHVQ